MKTTLTRISIILIMMELCLFSTYAQSKRLQPYIDNGDSYWSTLKGDIKEVRIYNLEDSFGELEKTYLSNLVKYDGQRTCIEKFCYDAGRNIVRRYVYRYNDKGDIIDESEYNSDGILTERTVYKYDDIRKIVDISMYKADGKLSEKCMIKHDGKGHKKEQSEYNSNGELLGKYVFNYDGNGFPVVLSYDSKGNLSGKTVSKYNKNGKIIEETQYKPDGKRFWRNEYKYDLKGNCVEKSNYDYMYEKSGLIVHMKEESKYDDKGNCVEKLYYSDNDLDNRVVYEYDEIGNRTKEVLTRTEAEIFWKGAVYEYEYFMSSDFLDKR